MPKEIQPQSLLKSHPCHPKTCAWRTGAKANYKTMQCDIIQGAKGVILNPSRWPTLCGSFSMTIRQILVISKKLEYGLRIILSRSRRTQLRPKKIGGLRRPHLDPNVRWWDSVGPLRRKGGCFLLIKKDTDRKCSQISTNKQCL